MSLKNQNMINWILQKNLTKPTILNQIKSALKGKNESWEEVKVIPFSNELPKIKNKNVFPIIYGSTTFMLNAFKEEALKAGVFYNCFNGTGFYGHDIEGIVKEINQLVRNTLKTKKHEATQQKRLWNI